MFSSEGCGARVSKEDVHIGGIGLHNHKHFGACERLKAVQVECVRLQQLYTSAAWRRGQLRCNGVQGVPVASKLEPSVCVLMQGLLPPVLSISSMVQSYRDSGLRHGRGVEEWLRQGETTLLLTICWRASVCRSSYCLP